MSRLPRFPDPCRIRLPSGGSAPSPELAALIARQTARRMALPDGVDFDYEDLESAAVLRALQAHDRYRPDQGFLWRTWIINNARWAIREELRVLGRRNGSSRADAPPDAPWFRWESLSAKPPPHDEEGEDTEPRQDWQPRTSPPLERWVTRIAIEQALPALPSELALVVRRRLAGQTLATIGQEIGRSESRVKQLLAAAILLLRTALHAEPEEARRAPPVSRARKPRTYPAPRREAIVALLKQGLKTAEISQRLAISASRVDSVRHEARARGWLPPWRPSPARAPEKAEVRRLYEQGLPYRQIASACGLSERQVGRIVQAACQAGEMTPRDDRGALAARNRELLRLWEAGHSCREIAAASRLGYSTVGKILQQARARAGGGAP